jgi:hypothetical protein
VTAMSSTPSPMVIRSARVRGPAADARENVADRAGDACVPAGRLLGQVGPRLRLQAVLDIIEDILRGQDDADAENSAGSSRYGLAAVEH